jgi:agmatinase
MSPTWFDVPPPFCDHGHAKVVVIPAPYEGTVSYGKGTSQGPQAIFEASPFIELYDPILDAEPYRIGIHGLPALTMPEDPWRAALAAKATATEALETARHPVMVGGEHSLSIGPIGSCHERYPNLTVLQLDAHADLRDEYEGTRFSHACVMRRVADLGARLVQAGIRPLSREEKDWLDGQGRTVMSSRHILRHPDWTREIIDSLSDHVYLTLDLDVLDPSVMPATGTPEPGGIFYHDLIDLTLALRDSGKSVVAMDMVELAPIPGLHHPQFLAASLLYIMIGAFFGE